MLNVPPLLKMLPAPLPIEKILLVDDVPVNLAVLTAAIEPDGYEILAAPNGAAALKVAAKALARRFEASGMWPFRTSKAGNSLSNHSKSSSFRRPVSRERG